MMQFLNIAKIDRSKLIWILAMLYNTLNILCDTLFYRYYELSIFNRNYLVYCVVFVFPILYIISDVIVVLSDRKTSIKIISLAIFLDGIYSLISSLIARFSIPNNLSGMQLHTTISYNAVSHDLWSLFLYSLFAGIFFHYYPMNTDNENNPEKGI